MGSTIVQSKDVNLNTGTFSFRDTPVPLFIQFVPGVVTKVITSRHSFGSTKHGHDANCIFAKPYIAGRDNQWTKTKFGSKSRKYIPLLRGITDCPQSGDEVLLCTFMDTNYYLGILNSQNSPEFNNSHGRGNPGTKLNSDMKSLISSKYKNTGIDRIAQSGEGKSPSPRNRKNTVRLQKRFINSLDKVGNTDAIFDSVNSLAESTPLYPIHGDMMLEGKHGNSIRIGSRFLDPYIIMSNNRWPTSPIESYADGTILSITSKGTLDEHFPPAIVGGKMDGDEEWGGTMKQYTLGSSLGNIFPDKYSGVNPRSVDVSELNDKYDRDQVLLQSGKIIISSDTLQPGGGLILSSFRDIHINTANNMEIRSKNHIQFDAKNIYIGKVNDSVKGETLPAQPLVFGNKLIEVLEELIDALLGTSVVVPSAGTSSTIFASGDPGGIKKVSAKLKEIISNYHFVEENNDGAEKEPKPSQ
tara:strand:+ start:2198 stop:3607 length:1410 start_codon:yes stop_codon:yes gene_type:complete